MTAIKVKDFNDAVAQIEYMEDWYFVESESGDMRFDAKDWSLWVRQGAGVIIEGCIPEYMTRKILKEIEGAEIF